MLWGLLFIAVTIFSIAGIIFLLRQIHRFGFIQRLSEKHKALSWAVTAGMLSLTGLFLLINVWAFMVFVLHLALIWVICRAVAALMRRKKKAERRGNPEGVAAIVLTAVYMGYGWFCAHHVFLTRYELTTSKPLPGGSLRVAEIADLHVGITLDGEDFARELEKLAAAKPDIVLLAGDFVDDDSTKKDMLTACDALGELDTKYGVYFIYGNHDKGYYRYRDFSSDELRNALETNGIVILEDESVLVDGSFYITGRQDRSEELRSDSRANMSELNASLDKSRYQIVLDHQPNDYAAEAEEGADLVLSGHTHGGHIFPAGYVGLAIGANDKVYGKETREDTDFIVSSGISGWAIPFKTGTISEIVVIDIIQN